MNDNLSESFTEKMRKPRLGFILVSLIGEQVNLAQQFFDQAKKGLCAEELDVRIHNYPCLTEEEVHTATKRMYDENVDCLLYFIGTWVSAPSIITAILHYPLPTIIWGIPDPATFSSVGANVVHGSMEELGIDHKLVYGMPDDTTCYVEVVTYTRAAMIRTVMNGARFGLIGGRSIGMYPSTTDPIQIKNLFGIEIEHVDQLLLVEYAREENHAEIQRAIKWLHQSFRNISVPDEILSKSFGLYFAIKRLIRERNFDFIGIKCLEELINTYTSCCLAISVLNSEGVVVACQSDINAAITMYILQTLTGNPTIFADINNIDPHTGVVRLVNCGTMPYKLAADPNSIDWGTQYEYMGQKQGACPIFCCRPGPVTFAMLARKSGKYVMQIAEGTAFVQPTEVFREVRANWPQAFVNLHGNPLSFYQNIRSNHMVVGYGSVAEELLVFCRMAGIQPFIDNNNHT